MSDPGPLRPAPALGVPLDLDAYERDFAEQESTIRDRVSWKFERRQYFEEQDDPSREALARGQWEESLRLLEEEQDEWRAVAQEDARRGNPFRRVRVVETPLTPYMQWEMHALSVQAKAGLGIRVVDAARVRPLEKDGPLPEVVILGGQVLYEVKYSVAGVLEGAGRFTDGGLLAEWERFAEDLYASGEGILSYVDRYVSQLPRPTWGREPE